MYATYVNNGSVAFMYFSLDAMVMTKVIKFVSILRGHSDVLHIIYGLRTNMV